MTPLVDAKGVGIDGRLAPTDLTIARGELVAVIGPNGGGKTSLLRALARTEDALGALTIDGHDIDRCAESGRRQLLSFVPAARDAAWPVSVADYLDFGLGKPDRARIEELVIQLELGPLGERTIDRLSTGERARVMLGRGIAGKAQLLLLDEPLSNLDPYWVLRTVEIVRAELVANDSAALVSVHDLAMAARFDRIVLVDAGAVIADGKAQDVLGSAVFERTFRVERGEAGWAISRAADRQSSQ